VIALDVCAICGGDRIVETGDRPANGADGTTASVASAMDCVCAGGSPEDLPDWAWEIWVEGQR